jgi:hypothetical protein
MNILYFAAKIIPNQHVYNKQTCIIVDHHVP